MQIKQKLTISEVLQVKQKTSVAAESLMTLEMIRRKHFRIFHHKFPLLAKWLVKSRNTFVGTDWVSCVLRMTRIHFKMPS